jgi:hypothetical protein
MLLTFLHFFCKNFKPAQAQLGSSQNIHSSAQLTLARAGIFYGSAHTGSSQEFFFQLEPSQAMTQLEPARAEL